MERVADCVIRKIQESGAGHVFMISGRGILYLTDAVARNEKIEAVCTYHEQGASFAATAYASARKSMTACLVSTGCAATNAVTACLCAYQDSLPLVFISGNNQLAENTRHTGMDIRTYGSQEADIVSIVRGITKYAVMLEDKKDVVSEVEKALFLATDGRRGPVWIDIPLDVQNMRIDEASMRHFDIPDSLKKGLDTDVVLKELDKAERPILLIGGGVYDSGDEVKQFVEKSNIPLVYSPTASDIYGTCYPLSIGAVGSLGGSRAGNFAIQNSDFVLAVGTKLCSQLTGRKELFARDARIVAVDVDGKEHSKDGVKIDKLIITDSKEFLNDLAKKVETHRHSEWPDKCRHWKNILSLSEEPFIKDIKEKDQIDLYSLMDELSGVLADDATVITDAGFEELIVPSAIRFRRGQQCLFPASQGTMGYAIPAIIGAYKAGRGNIICIVGDGSVMMNIQELQIISDMKIPVKILVINNGMYAVIRRRQRDLFRKRTIGNDDSDGVPSPDFMALAKGFGLSYRIIRNRTQLLDELPHMASAECAEIIEIISMQDQPYLHESYGISGKGRIVHRPIEDMSPFLDRDLIRREMITDMVEE